MCTKLAIWSVLLFAVLLSFQQVNGNQHFDGYSVVRLIPTTKTQLRYLRQLEENVVDLDFWRGPSYVGRPVDVMIPPHLKHKYNAVFSKIFVQKSTMIPNLEKLLAEERKPYKSPVQYGQRADIVANHFDDYQKVDKVHAFLDAIAAQYSEIAAVESIGQSFEKRDLKLVRIGKGQQDKTKPVIFLECGIHAREWISPATCQFFAQELVQRYGTDDDVTDLLETYDFYILPVLNADGYEYTHTSSRTWRKTRQSSNSTCYGTDANRNFGFEWGGQGASTNPCSDTYRGKSSFSEPETKAVEQFVLNMKTRVKAYFAVHSYGQYWLYPWGYTSKLTDDDKDLNRLAKIATTALAQKYQTNYTIGTSTNVLYSAAGGSDDWAYGSGHIKYAYTVELRDTGSSGFTLPKSQIRPTGEETTSAFIAFAKELKKEL